MTGAGSATIAVSPEDSFRTLPGTPTWRQPGLDPEIGTLSIQNQLSRVRNPDDPRPIGSREGNYRGDFSVTFSLTDSNFHDYTLVNGALASAGDLAPSSTWYVAVDTPNGLEERFLEGVIVENATWNYQQGGKVTVELTCGVGNDMVASDADAPATPGSIAQPAKSDIVMWHDVDFSLSATAVDKLQSLTIDVANMARFRTGQQRKPLDAVIGAYEPTLNFSAILSDSTNTEYAYGSSAATSVEDTIAQQTANVTFGTVADYSLGHVQPNSADWQQIISEEDTTDTVDAHFGTMEDTI